MDHDGNLNPQQHQQHTLGRQTSPNYISILQWNSNGILLRLGELKQYLANATQPPDIICIQETHLKPKDNFRLTNYNIERRDRQDRSKGGVATLIHNKLAYSVLRPIDDLEELSVTVRLQQNTITIANIYNPPNNRPDLDKYTQLAQRPNTIILGDFNSHSTLFGGTITDKSGKDIEQFIDDNNLILLNDTTGTRINNNGGLSAIDLSLTSASLAIKCNWRVHTSSMGSDHYPIHILLNEPPSTITNEKRRSYIYNRADWQSFKHQCTATFSDDLYNSDIATYCDNINAALITAADNSIPIRHLKFRSKGVPYWNYTCTDAVYKRNKAEKKMKRSRHLEDCIEYRRQKAIAQRTIRQEQQKYWTEYCNSLNNNTNLTSVWKMAKRMTGTNSNTNIPTLISNKKQYESDQDKANLIASTIASASSNSNYSTIFQQHRQDMESRWATEHFNHSSLPHIDDINENFELHELTAAIKQTSRNSSPGNDDISYLLLKHLPNTALNKLLKFYNYIWSQEKIAPQWKESIIIPIPKPGADKTNPSSYRPIALTSAICKIHERLVTTRLVWLLETNDIINPSQSAYRKQRCTLDHLFRLQDTINKSINNKAHTVGIFFDFSKAFDMLWKNGLIYKLNRLGITGRINNWINDFLTNRKIRVKLNNTLSTETTLENGTPQGSVISPILFLIMVNDYPIPPDNSICTSLFADDSAIWSSGRNLDSIISKLKPQVEAICTWCNTWGFKLNENKTTAIIFSKSRNAQNTTIPIVINGKQITTGRNIKFLGVTFDQTLTWREHIKNIVDKTKSKINLLRSVTGQKWGANKTTLLRIYRTIIRPKLEYAFELFYTASKSTLKQIDTLHNTCLRICCGAMKSTATDVLQNECGELPTDLRRKSAILKYAAKISASKTNPAAELLQDSWQNHYGKYKPGTDPFYTQTCQYLRKIVNKQQMCTVSTDPPWTRSEIKTDTELHEIINKQDIPLRQQKEALAHIEKYANHFQIYTDGSKDSSGNTAAAFFIPHQQVKTGVRVSNDSSILTAELTAIKLALDYVNTATPSNPITLVIFTDSLSAIKSLDSCNYSIYNSLQTNISNTIKHLNEKNIMTTIVWIPSHVGISGNEIADKLAREATVKPTNDITLQMNRQDIKHHIDQQINTEWQTRYSNSSTGKHYKILQPTVTRHVKYACKHRQKETIITRLRLGKCCLNYYLHQIQGHPTGLCHHCNTSETIEHFLLHCQQANIFYNKSITLHQALTGRDNIDYIYRRVIQLKRNI